MKNFLLKLLTITFAITLCLGVFSACEESKHTHTYSATYSYDKEYHWFECECGEDKAKALHNFVDNVCECGYEKEEHTHDYKTLKYDEANHWYECECGDKQTAEAHKGGTATETAKAKCEVCNQEYGELLKHIHDYKTLKYDEANHWYECECGEKQTAEAHKGGTETETEKAKCEICNQEYSESLIEEHVHDYKNIKSSEEFHWYECDCLAISGIASHKGGTATETEKAKCEICNQEYGEVLKATKGLVFKLTNNNTEYMVIDYNGILQEVYIPSTYNNLPVTSIGASAFNNCNILTSVTFGENSQLTSIGYRAFENCDSLTSITIGDSVTSIGEEAFAYCYSLTSITVDENNKNYKSIADNLYSKDGKTLIQYAIAKTETSFEIPNSVTSIGSYAFYGCSSLTSIVIPNSVTSIAYRAFYNCHSLTSIVIPNSVTSIGYDAFYACYSLIIIYCEAQLQPSRWSSNWNNSNCPVIWGYDG